MRIKSRIIAGAVILALPLAAVVALHLWMDGVKETRPAPSTTTITDEGDTGKKEPEAPPLIQEDWTADIDTFREKRLERAGMDGPPEFEDRDEAGWRIWGRVTRPGWVPLRDARVVFRLFDGSKYLDSIEPAFTDKDGRYALILPAPASIKHYSPERPVPMKILGWASAPGFHPRHDSLVYLPHPEADDDPLRLDFVLNSGPCILGLVESGRGGPVRDAELLILEPGKGWTRAGTTGSDGSYIIPVEGAGPFLLSAVKFGEGLVPATRISLSSTSDTVAPPLALRTLGTIDGTAVYTDGNPIDGLEIHAVPADLIEAPDGEIDAFVEKILVFENIQPEQETFEGLLFGKALTGPDGRFRMAGLKSGSYILRCPNLRGSEGKLRIPCSTGDKAVRLSLALYHVKVYLRDPEHLLIPEVLLHYEMDAIKNKVFVTQGMTVLQLEPGPVYLYATTSNRRYGEKEIIIQQGTHTTEVELIIE